MAKSFRFFQTGKNSFKAWKVGVCVHELTHRLGQLLFRRTLATMAPLKHFQYLVIGGGSGGIASARRAAEFGVEVGLIEKQALGGTCVSLKSSTFEFFQPKCISG